MFSLDGKVALVTGAGQNIGAGIARVLAAQGAIVAVNDYHLDRAMSTVTGIEAAGGRALAVVFDVTNFEDVTAAVEKIADEVGAIGILVNNAGTGGPDEPMAMQQFSETDRKTWAKIIDVNLYGVMNCTKAVLDSMIEQNWGRIITVSSGAGEVGLSIGVSPYAAAKAGAIGFMRHIASENAHFGITANTIAQGMCVRDAAAVQSLVDSIPVKRMGTPEDTGYLVAYLASPEAGFITGQSIGLNGGTHMK